jgi:hypothetical protein
LFAINPMMPLYVTGRKFSTFFYNNCLIINGCINK